MGIRPDIWWVDDDADLYKSTDLASIAAVLWAALTFGVTGPGSNGHGCTNVRIHSCDIPTSRSGQLDIFNYGTLHQSPTAHPITTLMC